MKDLLLFEYLERNAEEAPDDVALVEINPQFDVKSRITWKDYALMQPEPGQPFRREMTWKTFDERANMVANLLFTRGIQKGDKVAILLMNSIEWLPIYFGILKSGALAVPLNYRYDAEEIKYCLDKADCSMLVFGPEFTGRVESILDRIPNVEHLFYVGEDCPGFADSMEQLMKFCSKEKPAVSLTPEDDAAIYYSSGTTGFPKAILHAHRSLMHAAIVEQKHHGQTKEDVFLCIPPLYHTGAKMHWMGSLVSCSKAVLLKGTKPEWILQAVSDEHCTIVWLLVPWAQDILDAIDSGSIRLEDYELSQWRLMHIGAQPVPHSMIVHWLEIFPHQQYDTNYGLSESIGPGCIHLGVENVRYAGAIGVPGYGWQIKLCDQDGNEVPQGTVGEIWIKGPGVMKCYYKDEKATAETLKDGWLLSGDMALLDEHGMYQIVDRKKDVIISGGENIYPVQIEDFLHRMAAIKDVAVIGLPDARLGEISAAIIEGKEGYDLTESEVNDFCTALPRYKRPRKIIFAHVPRNPTGKIEKPKLRELYAGANLVARQTQK
ncbi:MAG TPA: class I adenylate-forming enzyme family protein [Clostridiales bacterium]|nr:class I adenylate-forming enzyme family protein [Clostridiales bacterium]